MKALFLMVTFVLAIAGLRYQTDHCHDDCLHGERAAQASGHTDKAGCDLGCQVNTALDICDSDTPGPVLVVADAATHAHSSNPYLVYPDGPFHPPRA